MEEDIEKYSVLRATMAIERSDVCLILIDATEGVTEQDTKVAGLAHEAGKASIIVVNKWDLIEKDGNTMDKMREEVRNGLAFMTYYMTQVGIRPPHFVVFCNDSRLFHFSYQRYLENCLRNTFGLEGTPITLSIRQRGEKEG